VGEFTQVTARVGRGSSGRCVASIGQCDAPAVEMRFHQRAHLRADGLGASQHAVTDDQLGDAGVGGTEGVLEGHH